MKNRLLWTEFNWHPFSIDEQLPLHKHLLFWWPISVFVVWAFALTLPFLCLCWPTPNEYDALLKQLGFPIFIASLAIPISLAVGRFHASKQRAKTNALTIENNAFNNFFAHRNYFVDYAKSSGIPSEYEGFIEVNDTDVLYKIVFPENSIREQNYRINNAYHKADLQRKLETLFKYVNEFVIEVKDGDMERSDEDFIAFVQNIPAAFGFQFSQNIAKFYDEYVKSANHTFFYLCFSAIKDTLLSMHAFNHVQTVGWVIELEFKPYFESLENNELLKSADTKAMERLVWLLPDDPKM